MMRGSIRDDPWDSWVRRVILHVPHYFSPDGEPTSGGRQRNVRDLAQVIQNDWGRDCVIVQKARRRFLRRDARGTTVIGLAVPLKAWADPAFGFKTARMIGEGDGIIYMGGEDAWPFIVQHAKGFHAGVWWDGPFRSILKRITAVRTESMFRRCRSVLCVDTNVINWLRARAPRLQESANRAVYIPNSVRLSLLPPAQPRTAPNRPLRILFARRFEPKRGPFLALDALAVLHSRGYHARLIMSTAEGQSGTQEIRAAAEDRGISEWVEAVENDMEGVFRLYQRADVAVVPTLWSEGTSYSCLEALAAGLPVVATTVGGLANIVVPGFNGFVVRPDADAVADALTRLCDGDTWAELHRNALSMRTAFSKARWDERVLGWLKG